MNILFADSQGVVRYGTISLVKSLIPEVQVFEATNHHQFCSQLRNEKIDILLLNTDMCGDHSIPSISKFKNINPNIRILLLSNYTEKVFASHLLEAGADGFINVRSNLDHIKDLFSEFFKGLDAPPKTSSNSSKKKIQSPDQISGKWLTEKFSERERSVLAFLQRGIPLREISKLLSIKPSTVSTYKNRIYNKLGVVNQRELTDLMIMAS